MLSHHRPIWNILGIVVLVSLLAGCDDMAPRKGWGIADIPADIPFERQERPEADGNEPAHAQPARIQDHPEQEDEPQHNTPNRSRPARRGLFQLEAGDSLPSQTERWGDDREMPSDSMPSETERWGEDREMPSDNMPSDSFPAFEREPLPSESAGNHSTESDESP